MSTRVIDLTGLVVGQLTVQAYLGHQVWRCLCTCGNTRDVIGQKLRAKTATACLVCRPPRSTGRPRLVDLTGQVFEQLTVEAYLGNRVYRTRCSCGQSREVLAWALQAGAVKRCEDCRKEATFNARHGARIPTGDDKR